MPYLRVFVVRSGPLTRPEEHLQVTRRLFCTSYALSVRSTSSAARLLRADASPLCGSTLATSTSSAARLSKEEEEEEEEEEEDEDEEEVRPWCGRWAGYTNKVDF